MADASIARIQQAFGVSAREISLPLLRADPHRWGAGLVHLIDAEKDQTYCGKSPGGCPGTKFQGGHDDVTCKTCLRSIEARARGEELRRQWDAEERARQENKRLWWRDYDNYLQTETWHNKRALVMRRAGGSCEGCGAQRAVQVHHRAYPRDCRPGSVEWIGKEKLFDLVALCVECHQDIHE